MAFQSAQLASFECNMFNTKFLLQGNGVSPAVADLEPGEVDRSELLAKGYHLKETEMKQNHFNKNWTIVS